MFLHSKTKFCISIKVKSPYIAILLQINTWMGTSEDKAMLINKWFYNNWWI